MKVVVVEFLTAPGGVPSVLGTVLPALRALGHEVTFVDPLPHSFRKDFGVPVLDVPVWPRSQALGWQNPLRRLTLGPAVGVGYVAYAVRLARLLRESRADLLYTHLKKGTVVGALAARIAGVPLVYHAHGFASASEVSPLLRWAISSSASVVAVSEDVRATLSSAGVPSRSIEVVYNGVDLEELARRAASETDVRRPDGAFVVLVAANLQPGKGVHVLVDAVARARAQGVPLVLWVAGEVAPGGDQGYLGTLERQVRDLGLGAHVRFLGRRADLPAVMRLADCVVLPSLVRSESFGMVLAEAAALGRFVAGSKIGGVPEVLGDDELLFEPADAVGLAAIVQRAALDGRWRTAKASLTRERTRTLFDHRRQVQGIDSIFRLARKGDGR